MERNFKRISDELKLPQESRERIRAQLASYEKQREEIPMKKMTLKYGVLLSTVVVVMMLALTLTAAAAVIHQFRNNIIVSSQDDIPTPTENNSVSIVSPIGNPPHSLDSIIENDRFKSDDWANGERINGGILLEYFEWDSAEVLSDDPLLRSRRVSREDGAEKMEYTAENPVNLLATLTGRVTFDLGWLDGQYDYVPDANLAYVVLDKRGDYVSEFFQALYAKPDGNGYVRVEVYNTAQADHFGQSYIIDGSYETAYYYTSADGYEFLIKMHNGIVWVECNTSHASINLYGAYLTTGEVEDILDNLSLTINE